MAEWKSTFIGYASAKALKENLLFSRGSDSTLGVDDLDPEREAGSSLGLLPKAPHPVRIAR